MIGKGLLVGGFLVRGFGLNAGYFLHSPFMPSKAVLRKIRTITCAKISGTNRAGRAITLALLWSRAEAGHFFRPTHRAADALVFVGRNGYAVSTAQSQRPEPAWPDSTASATAWAKSG